MANSKEKWFIRNNLSTTITIGDLPKLAAIPPNTYLDALLKYSKAEIGKSINLSELINNGSVSIEKKNPAPRKKKVQIYEEDEIDALFSNFTPILAKTTSVTTSTYTAGTNGEAVIEVDASSGNKTINLPAAANNTNRFFHIIKIDSSVNTVTVDGYGSETINGELTQIITSQYTSIKIVCNGSVWYIH